MGMTHIGLKGYGLGTIRLSHIMKHEEVFWFVGYTNESLGNGLGSSDHPVSQNSTTH